MPGEPDLRRLLTDFALDVNRAVGTQDVLRVVTAEVLAQVDGADAVGISLLGPDHVFETLAATDPLVDAANRFQRELDEGPCMDAMLRDDVVVCDDLTADLRWPRWSVPVVQTLGMRSVMSLRMEARHRGVGSLSLFARRPHAFRPVDVVEAGFFAAHSAIAIASAQQVSELKDGLSTRTVIGQAQGIIMERYGIGAKEAFSLLTRLSQASNVKLREIAAQIADTRVLPDTTGDDDPALSA